MRKKSFRSHTKISLFTLACFIFLPFTPINLPAQGISPVKFDKKYIDSLLVKFSDNNLLKNDSVFPVIKQMNTSSKQLEYKIGICESYYLIAAYYSQRSVNDSSLKFFLKAWDYGLQIDYDTYFKRIGDLIAEKYWQTGNYYTGLDFALKVKEYYTEHNYQEGLYYIYDVIGLIYRDLGDFDSALKNFLLAYDNAVKIGKNGIAGVIYSNIGSLYLNHNQPDTALKYYHLGVKTEEKYGYIAYAGRSYVSLAKIYIDKKEYQIAQQHLKKALAHNNLSNDNTGFARTYNIYGELYLNTKDYKKAIEYLKKAEKYANHAGRNITGAEIYKKLSVAYETLGLNDSAYYYFKRYFNIYQDLFDVSKLSEIKKTEYNLEVEKNKNQLKALEIEKQKTQNKLLMIIFILLLVITILFAILYFQSIKSKHRLQKINRELKNARIKAEESDQLKSHFLKNISHEIRTPLNSIIGFYDIFLNKDLSQSEYDEINYYIQKNSNDLISTINNMVDVAHLESNQYPINISEFNLTNVIHDVITEIENIPEFIKKNLIIELKNTAEIRMESDPEALSKILLQLLKNSVLFSGQGMITLDYEVHSSNIQFTIKDNGYGIAKEDLDGIFLPFQKGDEIDATQRGNGLGLTIVANLIKLLKGNIWVNSEVGKGSSFCFQIPISVI